MELFDDFEDEDSFVNAMNVSIHESISETHDYDNYEAFLHNIKIVSITSLVLLSIAFVVWCLFAIKRRPASPYRLVSFVMTITSSMVTLAIVNHIQYYNAFSFTIRILFSVMGTADLIVVFSLLGYNILCVIRVLKKTVTPGQMLLCVLTYILIAVVCTITDYGLYGHVNVTHLYLFTRYIPKLVSLAISLVVNIVLTYWLFVQDNPQYKSSREYKVMRYSCLIMYFVIGYFALQESVRTVASVREGFGYCLTIGTTLYAGQGILISVLLCFLDLEILDCLPGGCINVGEENNKMDDVITDSNLIANDMESTSSTNKEETHQVTSFGMDVTPSDTMQTRPLYGSIPKRP